MKKIFFLGALLSASVASFALPTSSAPEPSVLDQRVMSVYSDAYAPKADWSFCESWGQTTAFEEKELDGDHYLSYTNFNYLGWQVQGTAYYNCLSMEKLHIDVWADEAGQVNFYPILGPDPKDDTKSSTLNLEAGKWNSFDLTLASDYDGMDFSSIFQFKFGEGTISSFAVDNVYFYRTTDVDDNEAPKDFTAELNEVGYFNVVVAVSATDNSGSVSYVVMSGEEQVASAGGASGAEKFITVSGLEPGKDYAFAVIAKDDAGNATDAITVTATTSEAPAAAPIPELEEANVKALFSDAYLSVVTFTDLAQNWWQAPSLIRANLVEGDEVLFYSSFEDGAAFGWAFSEVNVAGYQKLHLNVYPLEEGVLELYPVIDPEDQFHKTTATLAANQWNEVVLDYTANTFAPMTQLGWVIKSGLKAFFVDNVYFFNEGEQGLQSVEAAMPVRKVMENGQLIILKNGVRYNAVGAAVR